MRCGAASSSKVSWASQGRRAARTRRGSIGADGAVTAVLQRVQLGEKPLGQLVGRHFPVLAELHDLTPELNTRAGGLGLVRAYYALVEVAGALLDKHFPGFAAWSEGERVICARYAAVQIDRRLQANLEPSASLRSC